MHCKKYIKTNGKSWDKMLLLQRRKKSWSKKRRDRHRRREREGKTTVPTTTTIRENERKIDENKTNDRKCFGEQQPETATKKKNFVCTLRILRLSEVAMDKELDIFLIQVLCFHTLDHFCV